LPCFPAALGTLGLETLAASVEEDVEENEEEDEEELRLGNRFKAGAADALGEVVLPR
jgi:hypothetical protein